MKRKRKDKSKLRRIGNEREGIERGKENDKCAEKNSFFKGDDMSMSERFSKTETIKGLVAFHIVDAI